MLASSLALLLAAATPTLAVSYFDNTSKSAELEPMRKGFADMLLTDLGAVKGIKLVERERLESVLQELKLSQTPFIDPKSAQKMGRGLAATHLVTGAFALAGGKLRVDARIVAIGSGQVVASSQVEGKPDEVFDIEKDLADLLVRTLELKLDFAERKALREVPTRSYSAFMSYSAGLDARDRGDAKRAEAAFAAAVAADPEYRAAKSALERLGVVEKRIEREKGSEFDAGFAALDPKAPDVAQKLKTLLDVAGYGYEPEAVARRLRLLDFVLQHELKPEVEAGGVLFSIEPALFFNTIPVASDPELSKRAAPAFEYFLLRYPNETYTTSWHRTWKAMAPTLGAGISAAPEVRAAGLRLIAVFEKRLAKLRGR